MSDYKKNIQKSPSTTYPIYSSNNKKFISDINDFKTKHKLKFDLIKEVDDTFDNIFMSIKHVICNDYNHKKIIINIKNVNFYGSIRPYDTAIRYISMEHMCRDVPVITAYSGISMSGVDDSGLYHSVPMFEINFISIIEEDGTVLSASDLSEKFIIETKGIIEKYKQIGIDAPKSFEDLLNEKMDYSIYHK